MRFTRSAWRRRLRTLGGLAAPVLLSLAPHASAGEPAPLPLPGPAVVAPAPAAPQVFDLAAARRTAAANQPAVVAARASLDAVRLKEQALDRPRLTGALLARDLPVRRKQACLGVTIASAALDQAVCDARQAATYCYLAVLYAREQQGNADQIRARLSDLKKLAESAKGERTDVGDEQLDILTSLLDVVDGRRQEAVGGEKRALAALREALGLGPDCPLDVVGDRLPDYVQTQADCETIVRLALARRGEVIETATATEVYCLEIDAQGRLCFGPARTFASGGDIHATTLPATLHDPDYHPGALAPEMPVTLPGSRADRRQEAEAYHARAGAVADKTRNLAALQAEDAFFRWEQYSREEPKLQQAADRLESSVQGLSKRFNPHQNRPPALDELISYGTRATQSRLDATEAKFRRLAALADLERVTGGGFDSGLDACAPITDVKNH